MKHLCMITEMRVAKYKYCLKTEVQTQARTTMQYEESFFFVASHVILLYRNVFCVCMYARCYMHDIESTYLW
jgi:hypothetical protein